MSSTSSRQDGRDADRAGAELALGSLCYGCLVWCMGFRCDDFRKYV